METWTTISKFPDYSVSDYGRVCNRDTGRILRMTPNPRGIITVCLSQDRVHTTKAVVNLVASEFLPRPHNREKEFDTPVNRNGYREDNHVENLMWRPLWFAVKYFRQFRTYQRPAFAHPIVDTETGIIFRNSWDAAVQYGLLDRDLLLCMLGHRYVFPTFQHFRPL